MNLPNKLTTGRLGLTAVFVVAMSVDIPGSKVAALVIFIVAAITDYLDGQIARKHNLITDFGKLMDPLADKVLTAAAFIGLIGVGLIPAWCVILIIAREFMITGLRLVAAAKNIVLPAEKLGKHKTTWQMVCIIYFLLLLSVAEFTPVGTAAWYQPALIIGWVLLGVATLLTVWSGCSYLGKNRALFADA